MPSLVTSRSLLIDTSFIDGDTRILTVKNPDSNITMNDIKSFETFLKSSNILIGDRGAADFNKIVSARRRTTSTVKLDID